MATKKAADEMEKNISREDTSAKEIAKSVLIDDVAGRGDWKRSKLGYLTGFSVIGRSISSVTNNAGRSIGNIQGLWSSLTASSQTPSLGDGGTARERFEMSMVLHNRSEEDLDKIISNTYKSFLLYIAISVLGIAIVSSSFFYVGYHNLIDGLMRYAPMFLTLPLAFKHAYTNWMVRNRVLDGVVVFLRSGDIAPKAKRR